MAALSSSVCVLFSLFCFALGGAEGEECFAKDTDYPGNDIEGSLIRCTAQQCQDLCEETEGCNVFTWSSSNQRCWLKSSKSKDSYESGAISGPKKCEGITSKADFWKMFDAVDGWEIVSNVDDSLDDDLKKVPKDGKLSADELRIMFQLMDESRTDEENYEQAATTLPRADIDGDTSTLNFNEFMSIVRPEEHSKKITSKADYWKMFDAVDGWECVDGKDEWKTVPKDGKLSADELRVLFQLMDESRDDKENYDRAYSILPMADMDGDTTTLNFDEFLSVVRPEEDGRC